MTSLPAAVLVALLLFGVGCSCATTTLKIHAPRTVNGGRPVQMLVRNVDSATFIAESYPTAATKVVTPDPTVLKAGVVYPGSDLSLSVTKPEKGELGVYFFFFAPGTEWKMLLSRPFDSAVDIHLGADRIESH
jgi:hypothetical protein